MAKSRVINRSLLFFIVLTLLSPQLLSQPGAVEIKRKSSSSELLLDPEFHPSPGTYYYDVFWQDIKVGKATISLTFNDDLYRITVQAKTKNSINVFYTLKYKGEVEMEPSPLKPLQATVRESTGSKSKNTSITFPQKNRAEGVEVESVKGHTKKVTERFAVSETFILDPFSVVFIIRHLDWHVGMAEVFDIFTGKKQYQLQLLCHSVTNLTIKNQKRQAWVIIPETTDISKANGKKRAEFKIYLSKDSKKEILKIKGVPRIGRIVAKVRKFEPAH